MKQLVSVLLLVFSPAIFAYEGTPAEQVNSFFIELSSGKVNESVDNLYSSNPIMQQKIQALTVMNGKILTLDTLLTKKLIK